MNARILLIFRLLILILGVIGIYLDFSFYYFTIESNIFVMGWLILAIASYNHPVFYHKICGVWHGAITLLITITFIIFATILELSQGLDYSNFVLHYVVPIAFIIDWAITDIPTIKYKWKFMCILAYLSRCIYHRNCNLLGVSRMIIRISFWISKH